MYIVIRTCPQWLLITYNKVLSLTNPKINNAYDFPAYIGRFRFLKFWPTNENFEIFKISICSYSGCKTRMGTSDSALNTSDIIFSLFHIIDTILLSSGSPTYSWNSQKTLFFTTHKWNFYVVNGIQNGTQKFRNFYHIKIKILSFPKPYRLPSYDPLIVF